MGEQEIELEQENIIITAGGAVNSVNGYTGDVVLTTSDLDNTSDYQTGAEVESAISTAIAGKQDTLTAGNNITISNNTISATDTTYSAGTGLDLTGTTFSVDTATIATQQDVSNEATARENADINLQGQIDAIAASSDVTDIVGTYAELEAYDTTHLKDNDIIKVLQDESQNDETTYYRWSTTTETFTLIGEEGPYYTKSQTDTLLSTKQDTLTAGSNITITAQNEISATDTTYSAGSGLDLTGTTFSVDTTAIQPKLTAGSNITIDANNEISATDTTYSNFVGTDGTAAGSAGLVPAPATTDAGKFLKADGTWDTAGGGGPTVVQTPGTSTTDVMSQNAVTSMIFNDPSTLNKVKIGAGSGSLGSHAVALGGGGDDGAVATQSNAVAIGRSRAAALDAVAFPGGETSTKGVFQIGLNRSGWDSYGYNNSPYRLLTGVYDGQSAHDAATYGQVISYAAINGAGAPTTATEGRYVGQLYYDTTNDAMYFLKTIDTTTTPTTYTWEALGGGGGGPTVVQAIGASTTDVMSQKAVTDAIYLPGHDPVTNPTAPIVALGYYNYVNPSAKGSFTVGSYRNALQPTQTSNERSINILGGSCIGAGSITIGISARNAVGDSWNTVVGASAHTGGHSMSNVCFGYDASTAASINGASAIGAFSSATRTGEMNIGSTDTSYGYNSSNYRLLTGLYDPQSAHDAATKGYVDPTTDSSAPTSTTAGRLGEIRIDTTTNTAYMCVLSDSTTPAYEWRQITA